MPSQAAKTTIEKTKVKTASSADGKSKQVAGQRIASRGKKGYATTVSGNKMTSPKVKSSAKNQKFALVKKETAHRILDILCQTYPDADCELTFENDYQLLVAVILSAQCTDVTVNKVAPILFKRFPTAKTLAEASLEEIKNIIRPTGFFNAKAHNIQTCAQALVTKFGGNVPNTLEELITLPGVGRKTANVVLGVAHGIPGWTVDTHVQRLAKRLGLTKNDLPFKIEQDLQKIFPNKDWSKLSITLIWHGRRMCYARNPNCTACPVNQLCPASTS